MESVRNIVRNILLKDEKARNSDNYLYVQVIRVLCPGAVGKRFDEVMLNLTEMGCPCFETVRRERQYAQAEFPQLKANDKVRSFRSIKEEEFKETYGHRKETECG